MSASVPVTTRWPGVVPRSMTAAGVSAGRPSAISRSATPFRLVSAIRNTSVSAPLAMPAQSTRENGLVGSSWPVMTAKLLAYRRSVTGMPA